MEKATVFSLNKDREKIISKLHKLGVMQLVDLKSTDVELQNSNPSEELKRISENLLRVSRIASILKIAPRKLTFDQTMFGLEIVGKVKTERKNKEKILKEANGFLREHELELIKLEEDYNLNNEEKQKLLDAKKIIELFESLEIPTDLMRDTKNISVTVGRIPIVNITRLAEELKKETDRYCYIGEKPETKKDALLIIITLNQYSSNVSFAAKKYGLNEIAVPRLKNTKLEFINKEIQKFEDSNKKVIEQIGRRSNKILKQAIMLREELEIVKEKFESIHKMMESEKFFIVQGWIEKKKIAKLKKEVNEAIIVTEKPKKDEEVPIELKNHKWTRPFEVLTELFALPMYKDLDPTFIFAPVFAIFAGFMLTDFFYGLGILAVGILVWWKFGKFNKGMKYLAVTLMSLGGSSMFFGILTGSYLGDLMLYIFGKTSAEIAIWKDPMADPLYFLIIAIAVGLLHLNIGLILAIIEAARKKQWKLIIMEKVIWFLLQIGVVLIYLNFMKIIGFVLLGIVVLMVIISSGPLGILSITGFMGDTISYSRLFALALATAGMAMTVNLLADLVRGIPYIGIVLAIIIFIFGHLFSMVMNALGAFVHALRLHFVEFFGKFYEGGGDRFEPFKEERVYTEVKD